MNTKWLIRMYRVFLFLNNYTLTRWLMDKFVKLLISVALQPIVKAVIGGLGPSIRTLISLKLRPSDINAVMGLVGQLYLGQTPTYAVMGQLTALDVQDIVEGTHDSLVAVLGAYGISLTGAQCNTVLVALGERLVLRHADPVVPAPVA